MQTVCLTQRVPGGGTTVGIGDGGQVQFSFVSEGKVASIDWCFRKMVKAGEARPKTSKEIVADIRKGKAWTWHQSVASPVTINECVIVYPQGNFWLSQNYIWPFYMLTAAASDGHTVTLYVPLEW